MGHEAIVTSFSPNDSFLRHIDRKRFVSQEAGVAVISREAFRPRKQEKTLSLFYQDGSLRTDEQIDAYREKKRLPSGDLVGLCRLTFHDLTGSLSPPRPPRLDPDHGDPEYGHLHHAIDLPVDERHMDEMAKLATRNGLVRPFERKRT